MFGFQSNGVIGENACKALVLDNYKKEGFKVANMHNSSQRIGDVSLKLSYFIPL